MGPDLFCHFYLVKNHKIANNPTTTEGKEIFFIEEEFLKIMSALCKELVSLNFDL
jgi:hypothetical protein